MIEYGPEILRALSEARLLAAKTIMYHTITVAIVAGIAGAIFALLAFIR